MREYGIFNDEGLIESDFYSREAAQKALAAKYAEDRWAEVCEVCPDHGDYRRGSCEECDGEVA